MSADLRKLRALQSELEYAHRNDTPVHTDNALRFVGYHGNLIAAIRELDKRLSGSRKPGPKRSSGKRSGSRGTAKPLPAAEFKRVRELLSRSGYKIVKK